MRNTILYAAFLVAGAANGADFGIDVPADADTRALSAALGHAEDGAASRPMRYTGRVGKVCQKQGCWMTLIDGEATARVMTGHRFALPADASGNAIVYGTLERRELDAKTAEHFAKESDATAAPGEEYRIDALAVRIL